MSILRKARSALRLLNGPGGPSRVLKRAGRNFRQWRLHRSGGRPFIYTHRAGCRFVADERDPDLVAAYLDQDINLAEFAIIREWLQPGDHAVDVGANVGLFSALLGSFVGPSGRILAVEASPKTFQTLTRVMSALGLDQVNPLHAAACNEPGMVRIDVSSPNTEWHSITRPLTQDAGDPRNTAAVNGVRLDDLLQTHDMTTPSFIKIDIEGAEPLALEGLSRHLHQNDPPLLMVEVFCPGLKRLDFTAADVMHHLPLDRFDLWQIHLSQSDMPGGVVRCRPCRLTNPDSFAWPHLSNLFAVPQRGAFANRRPLIQRLLSPD